MAGAEREEEAEKEGEEGHEGWGDMWRLRVKFVQHIWNILAPDVAHNYCANP